MLVNVDVDGPVSFVQRFSKKIEQMDQTHIYQDAAYFGGVKKELVEENNENTPAWESVQNNQGKRVIHEPVVNNIVTQEETNMLGWVINHRHLKGFHL
jgi:threonine aldolase